MYTASRILEKINTYICELAFVREPKGLYEPIRYVLSNGGKRIRPILMLMAYNLYEEDVSKIYAPAAAIEIYHNCTLLHDDLMDRADMRRGRKTVHKVWNDNTAILSGDAMLILAYHYITDCSPECLNKVLTLFNETIWGICEGQQYDMDFEQHSHVTEAEYIEMIRLKTASLLAASLKIGAILGGASEEDTDNLYNFGIWLGIAFQLRDDFLDVYGDPAVFGKNIGGDILCNKKTYLLIKALERANESQAKELRKWLEVSQYDFKEKIAGVTNIYNQLDIKDICEEKMQEYYNQATVALEVVAVNHPAKKVELENLAKQMIWREL